MTDFWDSIQDTQFSNEASVEENLVVPLLHALGYDKDDISPKHTIKFQEGRTGRPHEADFVVFYGATHDRNNSLIVVEAKKPGESFGDAKAQGESYASNIRTPFLLITDGINLEIWQLQITQESEQIVQTSVNSLCSAQGKIEACLTKEAAYEYCRSLYKKNILQAADDFEAYETAELNRIIKYKNVVERTISHYIGNQGNYSSSQLISNFPSGAVILAPSGYGKTTLSYSLLRNVIEDRKALKTNQLPFDIPLTDFAETGVSIIDFMQQRIVAHHLGVTEARLKDLIRNKGAILFCDGFERLSVDNQNKTEAVLNNLMRDFPKVQLFVFSRNSIKPNLMLPILELKPLTFDQQTEFVNLFKVKDQFFDFTLHVMPRILKVLCTHPLLLERTLIYRQQEGKLPSKIEDLFRYWLDVLLYADTRDSVKSIERESALTLLAKETIKTPINKVKAVNLFREYGFSDATFNDLIHCDALQVSGSVIELQHEALADYLRALDIVSSDESAIKKIISDVSLGANSLFPVLLMALLPSRNLQRILWERLGHAKISLYLNSFRYRYDVSGEMVNSEADDFEGQYLEDLIEGVEFPLKGFFPQLQDIVTEQLTKIKNCELAVTG